jgi:ABC-type transport system involved in cytochrome bd biosynthesis fused ATPase/permease subunit
MSSAADRLSSISRTSSRSANERVSIRWEDLTFETLVKDPERSSIITPVYKRKQILRGLSGSAKSGELLAILGPTGCGKTSLLNVLAARVPSGGQNLNNLTGTIYMNGKKRNEERFRKVSAYVLQVCFPMRLLLPISGLMCECDTVCCCAGDRTTTCTRI